MVAFIWATASEENLTTNFSIDMGTSELLLNHQTRLRNYAAYLTSYDVDAANDLLQETNIKVLENAHRFIPDTNFMGWVMRIMKNSFLNNERTKDRYVPLDEYETASMPFHQMQQPEIGFDIDRIKNELDRMPKEKSLPLRMRMAGYSYKEIAETTGTNPTTARTRVFNARRIIRNTLDY